MAGPWINKQIYNLNSQLQSLRNQYKEASKEDQKKLIEESKVIKAELHVYREAIGQKEQPALIEIPKTDAQNFEDWMKTEEQKNLGHQTGRPIRP